MDALDRSRLARWNAPTPRYTSYPTAPHFSNAVGPDDTRVWLQELAPDTRVSLYAHIPFCDTLCWFCGCRTRVVNRYAPIRAYLDDLITEIDQIASLSAARTVTRVHWGGGSPSLLEPDDVARLSDAIGAAFNLTREAEFAIEIDPRGFGPDRIAAVARAGLTRASIGVQDADPCVQAAINRIQTMEETTRVARGLQDAGVQSLNIDLVYGLPHQTQDRALATVDAVLELEPSRIAVFGYAHVPDFAPRQKLIDDAALPGPEARFETAEAIAERLVQAGYLRIGLDHFALPSDSLAQAARSGRLGRNFQGYVDDDADVLIGVGASAISDLGCAYTQNEPDVSRWRAMLAAGPTTAPTTARGVALTHEDHLRRDVIERLMCEGAVDLAAALARAGRAPDSYQQAFADALDQLEPMIADAIAVRDGAHVSVTPAGRPFVRVVAAAFDARRAESAARHAAAV